MDEIKRWLLRQFLYFSRYIKWVGLPLSVLGVLSYFGWFDKGFIDPWLKLSELFRGYSGYSTQHLPKQIDTYIFILLANSTPYLCIYSTIYLIYTRKYYKLYQTITLKSKYTTGFLHAFLDDKLQILTKVTDKIDNGSEMDQDDTNTIIIKILKDIKKSPNYFITSLLEPVEMLGEKNSLKLINFTIESAVEKKSSLERFIFTNCLQNLIDNQNDSENALNKIAKMHNKSNCKLYLIDKKYIFEKRTRHDINEECLDFLLIDGQVIYGLQNDSKSLRTKTASEKYTIYIKESKKDLKNYKEYVDDIKKDAILIEITP
jgi:hypothetical protein